jgi:hypothetical protein
VCIVTDGVPSMIDYENGMVSLLYNSMHELCLQNELIQHHYIIYQQNLIGKALRFKEVMTDIVSAVNFIR